MNKKIKDFWAKKPMDEFESAYSKAMFILEAIEFICAVGLYIMLKVHASQTWADLWMLIAFTWALHNNTCLIEEKAKERIKKEVYENTKEDNKKPEANDGQSLDSNNSKS